MLKREGYRVKTASTRNNKALRLAEMLALIVKYHKTTDLVLIDTYGAMNFYYAYLVGKTCQFYNVDYIPILHGGNLPERLIHSRNFSKNLFGKSKINIAPSQFLYEVFTAAGFSNTKIIPNAIELENYPFKERAQFQPKLLWVRRFQKRYNPMMAIKVLEILKRDYPDASLCMVGPEKDGSMSSCKEYVKQNELNVVFTGKLKKKDWAKLSCDYDFFINTTNIDNTPISVIEAMSLGLPVISTGVGGMPVLIEDGEDGLLVAENDEAAMAKKIIGLIENPQVATNLSLKARQKVENYDWDQVKDQWNHVLN